ncbi:MAG TPA: MnhB domain-containing protein [Gaiellaceae bacterium]|nr:MnhB domain-containing protein [Gaiellaceae bacterium]
MSARTRLGLFLVAGAGLAALLGWGVAGLPAFGDYHGPYGLVLNQVALGQRHATNVVAAVVFDYRGFDTLGEELMLFAAVAGVALILREAREEEAKRVVDAVRSEPVRAVGLAAVPLVVLLGLYVVAFGYLTPGGGFQGGVVVALGLLLVYLAADHRSYRVLTPAHVVDVFEGGGAAAFVALALGALAGGLAFQENFLPLGRIGLLTSAGSIPLLNWATAIEVTAAFVLLFDEFLEEVVVRGR